MTDFADDAQRIEEAERDSVVGLIRRCVADPGEIHEHCTVCADLIPPRRRAANPAATRCLKCQEDFESLRRLFSKG